MPNHSGSQQRLLVVVSDREGLGEPARAGSRRVRRWSGDTAADDAAATSFAGDPTRVATYDWTRGAAAVSAVIDLQDDARAQAVLAALRAARPDAAVLVLSDGIRHPAGDGTLARAGDLRDVIRLDLDEELQRLEAERHVHQLREFVAGEDVVPIVLHPQPDADAISSACALHTVLGRAPESMPLVTTCATIRSESRRMLELLDISIAEVTAAELRAYGRLIAVDWQARSLGRRAGSRLAIIDHHPPEAGRNAELEDIRPCGATATLVADYLRADARKRITPQLATALLYGIKTDTDGLMRGVTPRDVEAYAFLQAHADALLLHRLERRAFPAAAARAYGRAIAAMEHDGDLAAAFAGELDSDALHVLAELADFCLGIEGVAWSAAAAKVGAELVLALRHLGGTPGAGELARAIASEAGPAAYGGGHVSMGRVSLPLHHAAEWLGDEGRAAATLCTRLRERISGVG